MRTLFPLLAALTFASAALAGTPTLTPELLNGRWCEADPKVGCYKFSGNAVSEEALSNSKASKGTWEQADDMLILNFKEGPWTLEIVKASAKVLVLKDLGRKYTYTFTKR